MSLVRCLLPHELISQSVPVMIDDDAWHAFSEIDSAGGRGRRLRLFVVSVVVVRSNLADPRSLAPRAFFWLRHHGREINA